MAGLAGLRSGYCIDHGSTGPAGEDTLLHQLQAAAGHPPPADGKNRGQSNAAIERVLDMGANGIMVAFVGTVAEARRRLPRCAIPRAEFAVWPRSTAAVSFGHGILRNITSTPTNGCPDHVQIETPERWRQQSTECRGRRG